MTILPLYNPFRLLHGLSQCQYRDVPYQDATVLDVHEQPVYNLLSYA